MKISILLAKYLLNNSKLPLKEIGVLYNAPVKDSNENYSEKDGLHFEFNPRQSQDTALVEFISQQTGKMKSLADSDLESYLENGKQLLNIGKPFVIEGIASLLKSQDGKYFISENLFNPLAGEEEDKQTKHHSTAELDYDDYKYSNAKEESGNKKWLYAVAIFVLLGFAGWMIYHFAFRKKTEEVTPLEQVKSTPDINNTTTASTDTIPKKADSIPAVTGTTVAEYKLVLYDTTSKWYALKRFAELKEWKHPVFMETKDSVRFRIFYRFPAPFADSNHIRDSIGGFFKRKVRIE